MLCKQFEVEGLSHLCQILYGTEHALDIMALHIRLTDIIARVLAFVDDFDCEAVGALLHILSFSSLIYVACRGSPDFCRTSGLRSPLPPVDARQIPGKPYVF